MLASCFFLDVRGEEVLRCGVIKVSVSVGGIVDVCACCQKA